MAPEILNTLQELVVSICDRLYADRQLITQQSVKRNVQPHGNWSDDELEQLLPIYIKEWRLDNLNASSSQEVDIATTESVSFMDAQLCKYKAELFAAQQMNNQLRAELVSKNNELHSLRATVIQELRGLLHGK